MNTVIKILFVEDSENDALLVMHEISCFGLQFISERVETMVDFQAALSQKEWDIILCDFSLPSFSGLEALKFLREKDSDLPFIFISGTLPEDLAVAAMCVGATDYISKNNLKRLPPAIVRSITDAQNKRDKTKYEKQLFQAQKMDSLGQLVSGVVHDFNNLLMIIQSCLESITFHEREQEKMTRVREVIASGKELINHLLMFSRSHPSSLVILDLHQTIPHTLKLVKPLLGARIDIVVDLFPFVWPIRVDHNHFESALINLIINARDAMQNKGQIKLEASNLALTEVPVDIKAKFNIGPGDYVKVSVSDTGCGIHPDHLDRVFEPFFTTKEIGKGTGLGLSMVYGLVKQSKGYLSVDSKKEQGTAITLYFPKVPEEISTVFLEKEVLVKDSNQNLRILLAEDEEELGQIIGGYLKDLGYLVLRATNGKEALKLIKENNIHLILTDMIMDKDITGAELVEQALDYNKNLKYILMSGYSQKILINEGYIKNVDIPVLIKPFSKMALAEMLQKVLG